MSRLRLSCIIVAYNMSREIPRTVESLCASYQRGVAEDEYEVLVVDNGSPDPLNGEHIESLGRNIRFVRIPDARPSPAHALNRAAAMAQGDIVVSMIDGARMVSPGCLYWMIRAFDAFPDAVVVVPAWHLGPDIQNRSILKGYDQAVEDKLLASVDWRANGYELFNLAEALDPSSEGVAWFDTVAESNFIGLRRQDYDRLGGFDEDFTSAGGGAVNLDLFRRAVEEIHCPVVSIMGEGTFHQFHGGVSTNVKEEDHPWLAIHDEYKRIRNKDWREPNYQPILFGRVGPEAKAWLSRKRNILTQSQRPERLKDRLWEAGRVMLKKDRPARRSSAEHW